MATTKTTKTTKTSKATTTRKAPAKAPARKPAPRATAPVSKVPEGEYRPISMWGYFGWEIVYAIPLIGWIICIGQAFCAHNRNLRNFARSQFCWLIIWLIGLCVLAGLGVLASVFSVFGWV